MASIYLTFIEKEGPALKVWGQIDKSLSIGIEKALKHMTPQFDLNHFVLPIESVNVGYLCCAKFKDGLYYRARITNTMLAHQGMVELHFIDYGNKDLVPLSSIRTMASFPPGLITVLPQAREFILANVTHMGLTWDDDTLTVISNELRYLELQWFQVAQVGHYCLVKLFNNNEDVGLNLMSRGIVMSISLPAQQMILQALPHMGMPTMTVPPPIITPAPIMQPVAQPPPLPTLVTYKASVLEPGSEHLVYVSYVSDGPCQFSIQLQKFEDTLARLMKEINHMPLQPLEETPLPGTVCVARCLEDDHICRAVVTNMVDNCYRVFYVDFGNTEIVPLEELYQIPFKYVMPKVMAMRFALAGVERSGVSVEMKCTFKDYVSDKLLRMHVVPPVTRTSLPLCELRDDNNTNVLDVIKRARLLTFPDPVAFPRGAVQDVKVSYVYSCNRFFVQLKSKEQELQQVMADLQCSCANQRPVGESDVKEGLPCCALYGTDEQWYRAQLLNADLRNLRVRYVDYGNEEAIALNNLRLPKSEQVMSLRPQAVECCLNGYQNMGADAERDALLEELILESELSMKVVEMQGARVLVELIDSSRYNVASLLLEKIATARSQVSPVLIQENHQIETHKRVTPPKYDSQKQNWRQGGREGENKGWAGRSNEARRGSRNNENDDNSENKPNEFYKHNRSNRNSENNNNWDDNKSNNTWKQNKFNRSKYTENNWGNKSDNSWKQNKFWRNDSKGSNWEGSDSGNQDKRNDDWGDSSSRYKPHRERNTEEFGESNYRPHFDRQGSSRSGFRSEGPPQKRNWKSDGQRDFGESGGHGARSSNFEDKPRFIRGKSRLQSDPANADGAGWDSAPEAVSYEVAPFGASLPVVDRTGFTEKVGISWFHNPGNFYCKLQENEEKFKKMMEEIQSVCQYAKPGTARVGEFVMGMFPEDGVCYRAQVLDVRASQYRLQYVDYGNVSMSNRVWPIGKKFIELPAQALRCGLARISPLEDNWPSSVDFSGYFGRESFTCAFIATEGDRYLVELINEVTNVSSALESAGLARYTDVGPEQQVPVQQDYVDISLLIGQQLKVILVSFASFSDFVVKLMVGPELPCCLREPPIEADVLNAYELSFENFVDSDLIVYIEDFVEGRLEVTAYNSGGSKPLPIVPNEDAHICLSICPFPILQPIVHGLVTHITERGFFVQPSEYSVAVVQLLESLYEYYECVPETEGTFEVGDFCAVHSADENWYRGRIEVLDEGAVSVFYVDYGNTEIVDCAELRDLCPEYTEMHMLALEVSFSGEKEALLDHDVTVMVKLGQNGWEAELYEPTEETPVQVQVNQLQSEPAQFDEVVETATREKIGFCVILSHTDSPSEFYLQLSEAEEEIKNLHAAIQEQVPTLPVLENPVAGVLCAAPYSINQEWYRAQVLDADSDITTVRYVDCGNTDVLDNQTTSVKTLTPELLALERHARCCSLNVRPIETEWSPAACERFESLTDCDNVSAVITNQNEKTTFVELYSDGQNVADVLVTEKLAVRLEVETESSCTGYVSHVNSPSEFWIQLESTVGDLEWVAEQLLAAEKFPELEDLSPGALCAAIFSEDEMWYRARILSNTVAGIEVLFIDYGNSYNCTSLRQLPEDLIMLPALAQKCSLQRPDGVLSWTPEAAAKFKEISADGAAVFIIHKLSSGETSVVNLLLNDACVSEKLLPETVGVYISQFESLECFWLRKVEDSDKLEALAEKLVAAPDWPALEESDSCDIVAALYSVDGLWYRARVLSREGNAYGVVFVDCGIETVTDSVRKLMDDADKEDVLAVKCRLEPVQNVCWTDESTRKLVEISAEGTTRFQAEFVSPDSVRLYSEGVDVRSSLGGIKSTPASSTTNSPKRNFDALRRNSGSSSDKKGDDLEGASADLDAGIRSMSNLSAEDVQGVVEVNALGGIVTEETDEGVGLGYCEKSASGGVEVIADDETDEGVGEGYLEENAASEEADEGVGEGYVDRDCFEDSVLSDKDYFEDAVSENVTNEVCEELEPSAEHVVENKEETCDAELEDVKKSHREDVGGNTAPVRGSSDSINELVTGEEVDDVRITQITKSPEFDLQNAAADDVSEIQCSLKTQATPNDAELIQSETADEQRKVVAVASGTVNASEAELDCQRDNGAKEGNLTESRATGNGENFNNALQRRSKSLEKVADISRLPERRRLSVPHSERIVPGSICRGELKDDVEDENFPGGSHSFRL